MQETITMNDVQQICFVSQGEGHKMYTLWTHSIGGSNYVKPRYVKNLSTNKDEALKEAQDFAQRTNRVLFDESYDKLLEIKRIYKWTPTMVTFGKNRGNELRDCDHKFIIWVAKGCTLQNNDGFWQQNYFGGMEFYKYAQELSVELGLGIIDNERFYTNEQWAKIKESRDKKSQQFKGHFYQNGDRVKLELKLIFETGYSSFYGYVSIYTFIDNDNRVFTYKGTKSLDLSINNEISCVATIKHDSYNNENVTYIQRVKIK